MPEDQPKVYVELFMEVDASGVKNRLCVFEMPVVGFTSTDDPEAPAMVRFESRTLIREAKKALDKLL
jgi:hypothetical protein